jgi:hypothetical protein
MRTAVVGGVVIAGLAIAALMAATLSDAVFAQRITPHGVGSLGGLVTQTAAMGENRQQVTIIDPELHVMSVYHVEPSGEIVLKSVRNFHFDMQMMEFNSAKPSPQEIRSLLEQR